MNHRPFFCARALSIVFALLAIVSTSNAVTVNQSVSLANTGRAYDVSNANGSRWKLCIPEMQSPDLPANTIVTISSISIGSRNTSFTPDLKDGDASSITIVDVNGNTNRSSVINSFNGTINVNNSTTANRLTYSFSPGVQVRVGEEYFMALCKSDGTILESNDSADSYVAAGAKMLKIEPPDDSLSVLRMNLSAQTVGNWIPAYEVSGTVAIVPAETTIGQDVAASQLAWSPAKQNTTIQGAKINVSGSCTLNMDSDLGFKVIRLNVPVGCVLTVTNSAISSTSFEVIGGGEVVVKGSLPAGFAADSSWTGTVTLAGISGITGNNCDFNSYGNASSSVRLMGVSGWISAPATYSVPIVLDDGAYGYALKLTNGNSPWSGGGWDNRCTIFNKVSGSGTFTDDISSAYPVILIYDASEFTGAVSVNRASTVFCTAAGDATLNGNTLYSLFSSAVGSIYIASDVSIALAPQKTWYGASGFSGSGEVVCNGILPPANMFAGEAWKGTVAISNVAKVGTFNLQDYGNTNSTVQLSAIGGTSAYFPSSDVTVGRVVLVDADGVPALRLTDGYSDNFTTFSELAGSGTITQVKGTITQGLTINVMTNFTGTLSLNNMSVTFGTAGRTRSSGIYIDSNAVLSVSSGFSLGTPPKVVFDGPVNFTTDAHVQTLTLFTDIGTGFSWGDNAVIKVNGVEVWRKTGAGADSARYITKVIGTSLVLKRKHLAFTFR